MVKKYVVTMQTLSTATPFTPPHDRILRPRELASYVGLSLATLWRLRRAGSLPEPLRLSKNCVGWRTSVVDAWLASRDEAGRK
jgi:prophage regulatory protein